MNFDIEIRRRLMALTSDEPFDSQGPRRSRSREWLNPGDQPTDASHIATLSDEFVRSIPPITRETEIFDSNVEFLALRLRPQTAPVFRYVERLTTGAAGRRTTIGSAAGYSVDEARLEVIRREEQSRSAGGLKKQPRISRTILTRDAWCAYLAKNVAEQERPRTERLLHPYLERHGDERVSAAKRVELLFLINKVELRDPNRAYELHKRLRAFLSWCVRAGALQANPLGGAQMPARLEGPRRRLNLEKLGVVYRASKDLDLPWRALIGFLMLTGAPVDEARHVQRSDVDFESGIWLRARKVEGSERLATVLSGAALAMLMDTSTASAYFFSTARGEVRGRPACLHPLILKALVDGSGMSGWGWRDLNQSVKYAMSKATVKSSEGFDDKTDEAASVEAWAETLEWAARNHDAGDEGIAL